MKHLLNLLAAIALLVWGSHMVRTGVMRVFGETLRQILARSLGNRFSAALTGIGVTALVQSSNATSMMTASFVGQGLIALPAALAVMRGADVGTALMSVLFSADLSWLSPLLIFGGVVLFVSRQATTAGRVGRVLIGLGLMLLALRLVVEATGPLLAAPAVRALLGSLGSDLLLELTLGAALAVLAYSSLAIVLLIAAMAGSGVVPMDVALGLVLGANLGSGVLAVLGTYTAPAEVRQMTAGNLLFKLMGVLVAAPFVDLWVRYVLPGVSQPAHGVVLFHLAYNVVVSVGFIGLTDRVAGLVQRLMPRPPARGAPERVSHLDPSALSTPSLAIACAARETLHQADLVETMLTGLLQVMRHDDRQLSGRLRHLDHAVDQLYSGIKYYLTRISLEALGEQESRRWTDIIGFTINLEQIGDITERLLADIEERKIRRSLNFSDAGLADITSLHERLIGNLQLSMAVFLHGEPGDARRLLEEKARFGELERACTARHLARLSEHTTRSIETSSLHIDLIKDFKRINSMICATAYPVMESNAD